MNHPERDPPISSDAVSGTGGRHQSLSAVVHDLSSHVVSGCLSAQAAFDVVQHLPRLIWLDSASDPAGILGRYSFVTADPVRQLDARVGGPDPWPMLRNWEAELPTSSVPGLPPFQGGIAGLIGYEAATWLESVPVPADDDFPVATLSLGLYDWVLAFDHHASGAWLVSRGIGVPRSQQPQAAADRAAGVLDLLTPLWRPTASPGGKAGKQSSPPTQAAAPATSFTSSPSISASSTAPPAATEHATRHPDTTSNFSGAAYRAAVATVVDRICQGDSFQVNLAQRLLRRATKTSAGLYRQLRSANPAPFACYYDAGPFQVLSSSPEGFLQVRDRVVETRPIKGTVARTGDVDRDRELAAQLTASQKDHAENVMIVDLMRNDLSRVCDDDSIRVEQLCEIERYQYVQHLVSVVTGRLRDGASVSDLLTACFPGGSVTGAPKIEAMRTIAELEPNPRGPYCGSVGYISCGGAADFNILIRTITSTGGHWQIPVGGGITARSEPESEEQETWAKAAGMLAAIDSAE